MTIIRWNTKWGSVVGLLAIVVQLFILAGACDEKTSFRKVLRSNDQNLSKFPRVQLSGKNDRQVVMDNGIVQVTLSNPEGEVIGINYKGIDNLLATENEKDNRGYWDIVWYEPGKTGKTDKLKGKNLEVITEDENQVELSFTRTWDISQRGSLVPLNVDKRYILRRGESGFYFYAIMERKEGWPDVDMDQIRTVFKLRKEKFHFMAIADDKKRVMPMPEDRATGQPLAYPEAVLLTDPINRDLKGEVDDKYQYSSEDQDLKVHGWICSDPPVGFWMIRPSNEYRCGGPNKQDLTTHVGPVVLAMFTSTHYAGKDINTEYRNGEPWKKVFGPVFVYLNSVPSKENQLDLWDDAKQQLLKEVGKWPYNFPKTNDFPTAKQRGSISGRLQLRDRYISGKLMPADSAYVGLAAPGPVGSWQTDSKGYQFWTRANKKGDFLIKNVREGDYNLYAWVLGIVGDFKHNLNITVKAGCKINLGKIVYSPPRVGPTLWEIGVPDRTAAEFFVPDPYPTLLNKLYVNNDRNKFRQYGLWDQYADIYRNKDLQYTVGVSNYTQDWFFAHVTRNTGNRTYEGTTWQILFPLENVNKGNYTLQLALAAATYAELQVRFNQANSTDEPHFSTKLIGKDSAIARHGIHGLYRFYSIQVPSVLLNTGNNTIYLTQSRNGTPFKGIMYDYIRLEGPPEN